MDVREDLAYDEGDFSSGKRRKSKTTDPGDQKPTRCFTNLFFIISFLLTLSCFLDLCGFLCYYKRSKNKDNFEASIYCLRIINDIVLILPLLLYLQWAIDVTFRYFLVGIFTFLPQIILSTVSLILLFLQNFEEINQDDIDPEDRIPQISRNRFTTLKVSNVCNLILLIISAAATLFKVHNNF